MRPTSTPTWRRAALIRSSGRSTRCSPGSAGCERWPTRPRTSCPGTTRSSSSATRRPRRRSPASQPASTRGSLMNFDFDELVDRRGTWSTRWDRYAGKDVIPLWVADADFRAPPAVLRAMAARIEHGILGYTAPPAELRDAIVERLRRLYGWQVQPEWVVFLPGVVPGLHHAVRTLTAPGDAVLGPTPVYQHLSQAVDAAGRRRLDVPLVLREGRWILDLEALRAHAGARPRMLMLCNPQNPGGTVFDAKELQEIAAQSGEALIVSDEIHCDLVLEPGKAHVPIASLDRTIGRRCVTLMSPNKAFNFPGDGCA